MTNAQSQAVCQELADVKAELASIKKISAAGSDLIYIEMQRAGRAEATVREWVAANGPGGWIDDLRSDLKRIQRVAVGMRSIADEMLQEFTSEGVTLTPYQHSLIGRMGLQNAKLTSLLEGKK